MRNTILSLLTVFLLGISGVSAQELEVHGVIKDAEGYPISGAYVQVVGAKTRRVASDVKGRYKIRAAKGEKLKFSFVGMKNRVVAVTSSTLNVTLQDDVQAINSVVVTGYQKIRNRVFTARGTSARAYGAERNGEFRGSTSD